MSDGEREADWASWLTARDVEASLSWNLVFIGITNGYFISFRYIYLIWLKAYLQWLKCRMYLFTLAWIVNVLRSGGCFGFDWDQAPGGLPVCWPSPPTHNTPGYTRYTEYTWVQHGIHRIHSRDQELVWISEFVARRDARAAIVSCWPECFFVRLMHNRDWEELLKE